MRYRNLCVCLLLSFGTLNAQDNNNPDSLQLRSPAKVGDTLRHTVAGVPVTLIPAYKILSHDTLANYQYQLASTSPFWLFNLMPEKYSRLEGNLLMEKGGFIPLQESSRTLRYGLNSQGSARLGKVQLWGRFQYQKTEEDSTRWAHQTRNNNTTPYYFGSSAPINYLRNLYSIDAMASRRFLNDKLMPGLGVNYRVGQHYATNDPRGSITDYQLKIRASLGYQFHPKLSIGLGYVQGYGQETYNVAYKNPSYYESLSYPPYINYLMQGYGKADYFTANRTYLNEQRKHGGEIYGLYSTKKNQVTMNLGWERESQLFHRWYGNVDSQFVRYRLDTYRAELAWSHRFDKYQALAVVSARQLTGEDFNIRFRGNNYLYDAYHYQLDLNLQGTKDFLKWNYHARGWLNGESRKDGLNGNNVGYDRYGAEISTGPDWSFNDQKGMGILIGAGYSAALQQQFQVPLVNQNTFTQYVIYHDYIFNGSSFVTGLAKIQYRCPVFWQMMITADLGVLYSRGLEQPSLDRNIPVFPGMDRVSGELKLALHF